MLKILKVETGHAEAGSIAPLVEVASLYMFFNSEKTIPRIEEAGLKICII